MKSKKVGGKFVVKNFGIKVYLKLYIRYISFKKQFI